MPDLTASGANRSKPLCRGTSAAIGKVRIPLLEETLQLVNKKPSASNKTILETMVPVDLVRFTEIRARLLFTSMQQYLVSEHARDIDAIRILWRISLDNVEGNSIPSDSKSREGILKGLLMVMTDKLKEQSVTLTAPDRASNSCSLQIALTLSQGRLILINKQQAKTVAAAMAWIDGLLTKHPEMHGSMDFSKLTSAEQSQYRKLGHDVILPEINREQSVKDAELLKIMYKLSLERESDGKSDLVDSGGGNYSPPSMTFQVRNGLSASVTFA